MSTPETPKPGSLAGLASNVVGVAGLPWQPTKYPGIEIKVLLKDDASGLLTALFRWAPGSELLCTSTWTSSKHSCWKAASRTTRG
jgi:hypothetical protein